MSDYSYNVDKIGTSIRDEINQRIQQALHENRECFVAQFIKQNPDVNLKHCVLVHGFEGDKYTFSIQIKKEEE